MPEPSAPDTSRDSSHTGFRSCGPRRPDRSCSGVRVTVSPSLPKAQSAMSKPTSSERRNAPANPSRISARSRAPIKPASAASTIARISSVSVGAFGPRRGPERPPDALKVLRTMPAVVGESSPVALCASAIAFSRRWMLPDLQPPRAFGDIGRDGLGRRGQRTQPRATRTTRRNPASPPDSPGACSPPCCAGRIRALDRGRAEQCPPPWCPRSGR